MLRVSPSKVTKHLVLWDGAAEIAPALHLHRNRTNQKRLVNKGHHVLRRSQIQTPTI